MQGRFTENAWHALPEGLLVCHFQRRLHTCAEAGQLKVVMSGGSSPMPAAFFYLHPPDQPLS